MANMGYDVDHPPATTPGAISEKGQATPWHDDYDNPISVGPVNVHHLLRMSPSPPSRWSYFPQFCVYSFQRLLSSKPFLESCMSCVWNLHCGSLWFYSLPSILYTVKVSWQLLWWLHIFGCLACFLFYSSLCPYILLTMSFFTLHIFYIIGCHILFTFLAYLLISRLGSEFIDELFLKSFLLGLNSTKLRQVVLNPEVFSWLF